ncbi:SMC-Scp complex subunit ScpB [Kineococcus sp. SYSU DK006]|uniref:SMC-Scp complex subunit ScpB n=1 Tax=Kineococcus sp. SYSU DK006 TaxID=3383127 RepID=UPI003D7CABA6
MGEQVQEPQELRERAPEAAPEVEAERDEDPGRRVRAAVEAVLMVADEPVGVQALARAVGEQPDEVDLLLRELAGEYSETGRGFELREVGEGWRMYSRAEHADVVEAFLLDGQTAKLTQAALETLAVVAYRQPVSRARVSAVRGVGVDGVMRTLLTRGLVREAGVEATSGATLYATTPEFLQRMGLRSLDDLPPLAPFLPDEVSLDDLEPREVLAGSLPPLAVGGGSGVGDDGGSAHQQLELGHLELEEPGGTGEPAAQADQDRTRDQTRDQQDRADRPDDVHQQGDPT